MARPRKECLKDNGESTEAFEQGETRSHACSRRTDHPDFLRVDRRGRTGGERRRHPGRCSGRGVQKNFDPSPVFISIGCTAAKRFLKHGSGHVSLRLRVLRRLPLPTGSSTSSLRSRPRRRRSFCVFPESILSPYRRTYPLPWPAWTCSLPVSLCCTVTFFGIVSHLCCPPGCVRAVPLRVLVS